MFCLSLDTLNGIHPISLYSILWIFVVCLTATHTFALSSVFKCERFLCLQMIKSITSFYLFLQFLTVESNFLLESVLISTTVYTFWDFCYLIDFLYVSNVILHHYYFIATSITCHFLRSAVSCMFDQTLFIRHSVNSDSMVINYF